MSKHVPLHHRQHQQQQAQAAAASAPPQENSLASLDFDEAASFDGSSVADVSVTSSIFSQSFAGSIHQGLSRNKAKAGSSGSSSGRSSKRGGANDSSRSNLSSDSRDSARSWSSNPNSGNGSPTSRRTSHSSSSGRSSRSRQSSSRGKRLRIRFHPKVQCQVTLPRSSYTPQEKEDTWYSSQDGKVIQKDILLTVQTMRALHSRRVPADRVDAELTVIFGEERTDRGLEHMRTARSVENRRRHKASVSGAVLDEQSVQWDEGLESGCREGELRIAEASMVLSRLARDDAARKGRRDARFVQNHAMADADVDGAQGLDKNFEKMAVERAAVRNAQRESQSSSSSSSSSSRRPTLTRQDATTGAEWTTFGNESSNAFSGIKRDIKRELSKEVENPNDCCDASNTKAAPVPALRSKPKSHMGADILRRMRLAQLASLSSEASPSPSPCSSAHSRSRSGSESSADHQEDRKMSAATAAATARQPLPRLNDLRAHGA
eukprot:CAMPEP_0197440368 /NCGR_PEP_ID=MMETSP1175-20131217/6893_1 /TAXON_ID=1003142 /ORGANISM="Triceratium dubium, Strain CCMP147" /LENGTH=491 /DNA_ID=CAMNT_0042970455 /DNA_START=487 /DNA_END=1962 /DNA_ORIENTATION=-